MSSLDVWRVDPTRKVTLENLVVMPAGAGACRGLPSGGEACGCGVPASVPDGGGETSCRSPDG